MAGFIDEMMLEADPTLEKLDASLEEIYNGKIEKWVTFRASEIHTIKFSQAESKNAKNIILKGIWLDSKLMHEHHFDKIYSILDEFEKDHLDGTYIVIESMLVNMLPITEKQYEIFSRLIMP